MKGDARTIDINFDSDETSQLFQRLAHGEIRSHKSKTHESTIRAFEKDDEENITRFINFSNTSLNLMSVHQLLS